MVQVESVEIAFHAEIVSTYIDASSASDSSSASAGSMYSGRASASFSSRTSMQSTTGQSNKREKAFSMDITMRAVKGDLPSGVVRLMNAFEESIQYGPT